MCWGRFGVSGGLKEGMMVDYGDCKLACWTQEVRGSKDEEVQCGNVYGNIRAPFTLKYCGKESGKLYSIQQMTGP